MVVFFNNIGKIAQIMVIKYQNSVESEMLRIKQNKEKIALKWGILIKPPTHSPKIPLSTKNHLIKWFFVILVEMW